MTVASRLGTVWPGEPAVEVPALTLREVLRRTDMDDFDLVCDIEGAESVFLLQDPGAPSGCRRAVIELPSTAALCRCPT
ncbi:MAG: hypothetical protein ACRDPY_17100 [Streptosporangiaceae bacterium]